MVCLRNRINAKTHICDFAKEEIVGQILAFAMQKGGVDRTTTVLNLGVALATGGAKVLLLDIDPQSNLTRGLGIDPDEVEFAIYEVLLNPEKGIEFAIQSLRGEG